MKELEGSGSVAGPVAIIGLLSALWAASGYIGGFIRASNAIYEMEEGRPIWKTLPLRVGLTLAMVILLGATALGVVLTGGLAEQVGQLIGLGRPGVLVWNIAKWPVLALLISLAIALLYWASPNVRQPGFRWLTPGSALAVLLWVLASARLRVLRGELRVVQQGLRLARRVMVFLIWLWISNLAVLLGAEFDAELARSRQIADGHPEEKEPFLQPRDTRAMD